MLSDSREFGRWRNRMLFVSAGGWFCIFAGVFASGMGSGMTVMPESHSSHVMSAGLLEMYPRSSWMIGWVVMLLAMMTPTLIVPLWYVRVRSLRRRRWRSSALFVFGYTGVWIIFGALFSAVSLKFDASQSQAFWLAAGLASTALIWQTSPAKQRCLNRCHVHKSFAAFGTSADVDALRFGITHALWCFGSCWALMLFPMLLPQGHVAAMVIASIVIFAERLERPRPPSWRLRGLGKATRVLLERSRAYQNPAPVS